MMKTKGKIITFFMHFLSLSSSQVADRRQLPILLVPMAF